jgi:hypothetical protein
MRSIAGKQGNPSGTGWSQSGNLTAGSSAQSVNLQCNFDDQANNANAVYTIQFKVGPANTNSNQNPSVIQPSPTPANPPLGIAKVTQNSPNFTLQSPVNLQAGSNLVFDTQPTKIYTLLTAMTNSINGTLQTNYTGITTNIANVSVTTVNPIPSSPAVPGPAQPVDPVAIIQFTVQGNKVQRIISVSNGISISGPAEAIQVMVIDNTSYVESEGFQYQVTIQVTPGVRAAVNQPAVLYWSYPPNAAHTQNEAIEIAPGASLDVLVPVNAGVVSACVVCIGVNAGGGAPWVPPQVAVTQLAGAGINIGTTFQSEPGVFIPIMSNCSQLQLQNNDQTNSALVAVIWGIDG